MRRILILSLILMASLAVAGEDAEPVETTVEGEILDLGCYTARLASGPDHQECAARCLKNGNPAGLLTADGTVYTIAGTAPSFEKYAAARVKITGKARGTLLRASTMHVWSEDGWVEVAMNKFGSPLPETTPSDESD